MKITIEAEDMQEFVLGVKDLYELLYDNPSSPLDQGGAPKPKDDASAKTPTRDDIAEQMSKIMAKSGTDCINKILASLGATSLVDLPDDKLTDLVTALNEIEKEK